MLTLPIWIAVVIVILVIYLIVLDIRLHRRVKKLESVVRRLEGITDEDIKEQIREKMNR